MPERTLVIETATAACSVALIEEGAIVARAHEVVGRGHAERLVPMIAELPVGGRAEVILVDVGPGSFTGVRVGIAAARGLALGWGAEVRGFSSLALIAAAASHGAPDLASLAVVIEGGHGEVFLQGFVCHPLAPDGNLASLKPEAALAALGGRAAFGNSASYLAPIGGSVTEALPNAADAILLPPDLAALDPKPIYGRAPDAKPKAA